MKTWALDENGDYSFVSKKFVWIEDADNVMQKVRVRIETTLSEWFLNPDMGFARYDILGQKFDEDQIKEAITLAITEAEGVESVVDVYSEKEESKVSIWFVYTYMEEDEEVQVTDSVELGAAA